MPTVHVPIGDEGVELFYADSGVPNGSTDYVTIVLVHGVVFHGEIFRRLVPFAEPNNLRLIRLNWREYPGSSPYSQEEIEIIHSGNQDKQAEFVKKIGRQLAAFLEYVVKNLDIPKLEVVNSRNRGGLAVLSWSMGNVWAMSFLGNAQTLPEETRVLLGKYLRTFILFDAAITTCCGLSRPEGLYHPFWDTSIEPEKRKDYFLTWISYYFTKIATAEDVTAEQLRARTPLHEFPADSPTGIEPKIPSVLRMTPEEREAVSSYDVLLRSNLQIIRFPGKIFNHNFERAVFDTGGLWPDAKVLWMWGDESVDDYILGAQLAYQRLREPLDEQSAKMRREIEVVRIEGGNHFSHWDIPDTVVKLIADHV